MSDNQNTPDEEPISLEPDTAPQPVPVPVPPPAPKSSGGESTPPLQAAVGPPPVPVRPPAKKLVEEDETITLVDDADVSSPTTSVKRISGAAARGLEHKLQFDRPLNLTGKGATRCRLFTSKISEGPLLHMENTVNEWLDKEEIEIKHVGHVIGTLEGKRAEPNLLVMVWY